MSNVDSEFKIDWSSRSTLRGPRDRSIGDLLRELRDRLASGAMGVSISYVDDRQMRKLNQKYRAINRTTDVLSFPAEPEKGAFPHLGDIVISLPTAEKMAKKMGVSRRRAVETLVIHGFLHLCGHDHEQEGSDMMSLQAQLEKELLKEAPLSMVAKRGRKPGSKVKVLKDGSRKVVTGRAAQAVTRKAAEKKAKPAPKRRTLKTTAKAAEEKPKRGPGRPRKVVSPAPVAKASRKAPRRRAPVRTRSGIIA